ncbi:MAG: phosphate acyltransferase PlsX [Rhizobiales bacterium]|nr:phosphate acyltransferase PlsX [Hyphomicrobiales bacterium]
MLKQYTISVDAMGGDLGAEMVIPGVETALKRHPRLRVMLYGDEKIVGPLLDQYPEVKQRSEFIHTDVWVEMDDKPSQALRRGRRVSSMWLALEAVKNGHAKVAISAGNTGAWMVMAKFVLSTMPGIARPAMAAIWPTVRGKSIVLDVGANIGADAEMLVDFSIMGEAMARCLFGIERPTVGLLNVGVEEIKGVEQVKAAGQMLRNSKLPIEYFGFVEGDDVGKGTVDVVVTEGFTGNIALKTAEGTARQLSAYLKAEMGRSWMTKLGFLLARGAFASLKEKMDPRNANGGVFLGLNGIVVKSHGGTDAVGFASAMEIAVEMARNELVEKIAADLASKHELMELGESTEEPKAAAAG